jgi:hypothetical protein
LPGMVGEYLIGTCDLNARYLNVTIAVHRE